MKFEQYQEQDKTIIKIILDEKISLDELNILKLIAERANKELLDYKQKVREAVRNVICRRSWPIIINEEELEKELLQELNL